MLGYDGRLYILAFDHRGSFQKKMFGISGDPSPEQTETIKDAKQLIYDGMVRAAEKGVAPEALGVLVDEQFGGSVPQEARKSNLKLAMPVEKSGQNEFDFEYGEQFGEHIESFNPDFSKVLVRYNPEGDAEMNKTQLEKLRRLSDWLHEHDRKFLFELLVPAEAAQLESVGGEEERYDVETRPGLMRQAIAEIQDAGIEADIWKIEGVDSRADNETIAEQTRSGSGRENVKCVVLGRGASNDKVDHWLREAAGVDGFEGFAIGRSIWWDSLKGYLEQGLEREKAVEQVADNYLRFISVYEEAEKAG